MNIGERLKVRRRKARLTQEQVAEQMSITRQTLSNWETGKNYPDIDSIIRLGRIYQLSLDELLLGRIFFRGVQAMARRLTEAEIEAIIRNHFPSSKSIRQLNGGLVSQTRYFEDDQDRYVFQVGNRLEAYKKEEWVYRNFNSRLPLRKVLEIHESEGGLSYAISDFIEGSKLFDLNSQEQLDIVPSVMNILEVLESIEVSGSKGYGRYDSTGYASYPSWLDFVSAVYNEAIYNWSSLEEKGLDADVVNNAIRELKAHIGSVSLSRTCLVHGDLGSFNLLGKDGRISGVIDWSLSMFGDHVYDKANILFWNEDKLQPLVKRISDKYITSAETKEKIYCYMLRIGLEEIYNTAILDYIGYDIGWVANRLQGITDSFLISPSN